jgi:hypothetical protein
VIRSQPAQKPHQFHVAQSLALKPTTRLHPVEIAVDIELQQDRRVIRGPPSYLGSHPVKSQPGQIEFINKDVNRLNGIVLVDPIFQALWKQRALSAICALNKALHPILRSSQNQRCRIT